MVTAEEAAVCRAIIREKSHTFYLGTLFLPREERRATWALYSFCRTVDDIADEPRERGTLPERERDLRAWTAWVLGRGAAPAPVEVSVPLRRVLTHYQVPARFACELIDGLVEDLPPRRLATEAEMWRYCYQVASTVGLMMIHLLGFRSPAAPALAAELGAAMQITNILRDVAADAARGCRYVPDEILARVGCPPDEFERGELTAGVHRALDQVAAAAAERYRRARALPACLPPRNRLALVVAAHSYAGILADIRRHGNDVFSRRAHVSTAAKLSMLPKAAWQAYTPARLRPAAREWGSGTSDPRPPAAGAQE